jgi:hypothetical protein
LAYCSPSIKLSYVFSAYYEFNPVDSSCNFDGNATLSNSRKSPLIVGKLELTSRTQHCPGCSGCRFIMYRAGTIRRCLYPFTHIGCLWPYVLIAIELWLERCWWFGC